MSDFQIFFLFLFGITCFAVGFRLYKWISWKKNWRIPEDVQTITGVFLGERSRWPRVVAIDVPNQLKNVFLFTDKRLKVNFLPYEGEVITLVFRYTTPERVLYAELWDAYSSASNKIVGEVPAITAK